MKRKNETQESINENVCMYEHQVTIHTDKKHNKRRLQENSNTHNYIRTIKT